MGIRRDSFQALADPTRRALLTLLFQEARTPKALAASFQISRQAISRHLALLMACGLIEQEPKGREIYYRILMDPLKEIDHWLEPFRASWTARFDQLDHVLWTQSNQPL